MGTKSKSTTAWVATHPGTILGYELKERGISQKTLVEMVLTFFDIFYRPYENIRDELCAFISNNSKFTIKEATEITEYLLNAKSEFVRNYSRVRILATDR